MFAAGTYMTPDNINSEFLNNWINKLIIKDENYIYSLAQVSPDIQINNENAKVVSVIEGGNTAFGSQFNGLLNISSISHCDEDIVRFVCLFCFHCFIKNERLFI